MLQISNYKKVSELRDKDWNVNIFGVVKYFQRLPQTKTGDHHMIITLIDDSVGEDVEAGVRCNIFAKEAEQVPSVTKVGDVVLLKQVKVTSYNNRLQVQRTADFQWIVFDVKKNATGKHVVHGKSTSLLGPSFKQYEKLRLKELLDFLGATEKKIADSESACDNDSNIQLLKDLTPGSYVDVIVQVLGLYEFENRSEKALLLKVTDGSEVRYSSLYQMGIIRRPKSQDCHEPFPVGHSCEITVFDDHVDSLRNVRDGDFIKIVNLHVKGVSPQLLASWKNETGISGCQNSEDWRELIVHSGTKFNRGIRKLAVSDASVGATKKRIENLVACFNDAKATVDELVLTVGGPERGSSSTTNDYPTRAFTCVSYIIAHPMFNKFRLKVRVLRLEPRKFNDIIVGKCVKCNRVRRPFTGKSNQISLRCFECGVDSLNIMYFLRLLIEDDTGLLHVVAMGNDATYFFNDIEPSDIARDCGLMSKYEEKLKSLDHCSEGKNDLVDAPVMDLCVAKECLLKNQSAMYRLFGTRLHVP